MKGLKIHQTKMGGTMRKQVGQCTQSVSNTAPGETEEAQGLEPPIVSRTSELQMLYLADNQSIARTH